MQSSLMVTFRACFTAVAAGSTARFFAGCCCQAGCVQEMRPTAALDLPDELLLLLLAVLAFQVAAAKLAASKKSGPQLPGLTGSNAVAVDAALSAAEGVQDDEVGC
jgi:hypothetical protein